MERVGLFDEKLKERNQILQQFGEALELKVDAMITDARLQIDTRLDAKIDSASFHEMKAEVRGQFDKVHTEAGQLKIETQKKHENVISGIIRTNEENSDKFGHLSLKLSDQQDLLAKL